MMKTGASNAAADAADPLTIRIGGHPDRRIPKRIGIDNADAVAGAVSASAAANAADDSAESRPILVNETALLVLLALGAPLHLHPLQQVQR